MDIPAPWDFVFAGAALFLLGAAAVGLVFIRRLLRAVEFLRSLLDDLVDANRDAETRREEWERDRP